MSTLSWIEVLLTGVPISCCILMIIFYIIKFIVDETLNCIKKRDWVQLVVGFLTLMFMIGYSIFIIDRLVVIRNIQYFD
jgi:uncharacterized protein YqhQ